MSQSLEFSQRVICVAKMGFPPKLIRLFTTMSSSQISMLNAKAGVTPKYRRSIEEQLGRKRTQQELAYFWNLPLKDLMSMSPLQTPPGLIKSNVGPTVVTIFDGKPPRKPDLPKESDPNKESDHALELRLAKKQVELANLRADEVAKEAEENRYAKAQLQAVQNKLMPLTPEELSEVKHSIATRMFRTVDRLVESINDITDEELAGYTLTQRTNAVNAMVNAAATMTKKDPLSQALESGDVPLLALLGKTIPMRKKDKLYEAEDAETDRDQDPGPSPEPEDD